jgi:tetratricopeptide (TPR) repeat protein
MPAEVDQRLPQSILLDLNEAREDAFEGYVERDAARKRRAISTCDRVVALHPGSAHAHSTRGYVLYVLGHLEDAMAACDWAIELDPHNAEAHANRGHIFFQWERFADALAALRQAIALGSGDIYVHKSHAHALSELGRADEALAVFDHVLDLDPAAGDVYYYKGLILAECGRLDEAIESFERAARLAPDDARIHLYYGRALAKAGRLDEAVAEYDRVIADHSYDGQMYVEYSDMLLKLGRFDEAIAACYNAQVFNPDNAGAIAEHFLNEASAARRNPTETKADQEKNPDPANALANINPFQEENSSQETDELLSRTENNSINQLKIVSNILDDNIFSRADMDETLREELKVAARRYGLSVEEVDKILAREALAKAVGRIENSSAGPEVRAPQPNILVPSEHTSEPISTPTAASKVAPLIVSEEMLFGDAPSVAPAKSRQKYVFPDELLTDPQALRKAESLSNARTYKKRKDIPLSSDEDIRGKIAGSFVQQAKRRQQRLIKPDPT